MQLICAKCSNKITANFENPVEVGQELKGITCEKCGNREFMVTYIDEEARKIWVMPSDEVPVLEWMTIADIAELTGLSIHTVRNHITAKQRKRFSQWEIRGYVRKAANGSFLVHRRAVMEVYKKELERKKRRNGEEGLVI